MSDSGIELEIKLVEEVSKPANDAAEGLSNIKKESGETQQGLDDVGDSAESSGMELNAEAEIAEKAYEALKKVVEVAEEFVKLGVESKEFHEETLAALTALEGTGEAADHAYDQLTEIANATGQPISNIAKQYESLRRLGVDQKTALDAIEGGLDIGKLGGSSDAYVAAIEKIKSTGKLDARELKELGLPVEQLEENLAKAHGIVIDKGGAWKKQIEAMMQSGKISANEGINAILLATQKLDGPGGLGSISEKLADESPAAQIQIIKNEIGDLFSGIDAGTLAKVLGDFGHLLDADTESGKEIRAVINGFFELLGKGAEYIEPIVEAFGGAFWDGIKTAVEPLIDVFKEMFAGTGGPDSHLIEGIRMIGSVLGFVAGVAADFLAINIAMFTTIDEAIVEVVGYLGDFLGEWVSDVEQMGDAMSGFVDSAESIATNFIDGLVQGIEDGASAAINAVEDLASNMVDSAKSTLGISSPSKVFADIGYNVGEGFAQGASSNDNAQSAMEDMISPPAPKLGGIGGAASSSSVSTSHAGNQVLININVGAGASASQVVAELEPQLVAMFDRLGLQAGAPKAA